MRLGDRAQPVLASFFHDGGRVYVLVVCGDGYATPPRPRTEYGLEVWLGRKRRILCNWVRPRVFRGGRGGVVPRLYLYLPLFPRVARGAMPPTVQYCGGTMYSDQI